MTNFLITILSASGFMGLGFAAVTMIAPQRPALERFGLGIVLGISCTSWLSFLWSLAGGHLEETWNWALLLFSLVAGAVSWFMTSGRSRLPPVTVLKSNLAICCQFIISLLILTAFIYTLLTPQRFWDERAIFAVKAKVLWSEETISSPVLLDPDFAQYHAQYPLLIPLAEQHIYSLLGSVEDRWSKVIFPLLYTGLLLTFAGVLSRRFSPGWGWLSATLLATTPVLMPYEYGFICGQADAPVACFHGLATLYLWDAILETTSSGRTRSFVLAGLLASSATFTKDEGFALMLIDLIAWFLAMLIGFHGTDPSRKSGLQNRFPARDYLLFIGTALPFTAAWFWHRRSLPDTTEMHYFSRFSLALIAEQLPTLNWTLPHLIRRMLTEWRTWGLHWWLAIASALSCPGRILQPSQLLLAFSLAGSIAALVLAGMIAPAELEEHIGGSSHRYLMQLAPVALLLAVSQWSPESRTPEATPSK